MLYGTAQYGGTATSYCQTGCGTVFKLGTAGVEKTLYKFRYSPTVDDGAFPAGGLIAVSGELYGTTEGGGSAYDGTVFKVNPSSGAESVLHSFNCCSSVKDGVFPYAGLTVVNSTLYGTTRNGGTAHGGTVFVVTTSGSENVLHDFTGKPDGSSPQAALLYADGRLYGTTAGGGSRSEGSVFEQTP